jgi:hypothetical protein
MMQSRPSLNQGQKDAQFNIEGFVNVSPETFYNLCDNLMTTGLVA